MGDPEYYRVIGGFGLEKANQVGKSDFRTMKMILETLRVAPKVATDDGLNKVLTQRAAEAVEAGASGILTEVAQEFDLDPEALGAGAVPVELRPALIERLSELLADAKAMSAA